MGVIHLTTDWIPWKRIRKKLEMNPPLVLPSARSGAEELDEVICGHIEQSIQIDSPEAELLERPLLRHPRRHFRFYIRLSQKRTRIHKFIERDEREREDLLMRTHHG